MQIIPEQISLLRQRENELLKKYAEYKEYIKNREVVGCEETSISQIGDSIIESQYQRDITELKEIRNVLETADYVTERPTDKIGIGTKFIIRFTGEDETNAVMLTDFSSAMTNICKLISTKSPVGAAVLGKKAGDDFRAVIVDNNNQVRGISTGTIENIEKDPSAYLHFIREKDFHLRRSKKDIADYKLIQNLSDEEKQTKLDERFTITASQRGILLIEKERLERQKNPDVDYIM